MSLSLDLNIGPQWEQLKQHQLIWKINISINFNKMYSSLRHVRKIKEKNKKLIIFLPSHVFKCQNKSLISIKQFLVYLGS